MFCAAHCVSSRNSSKGYDNIETGTIPQSEPGSAFLQKPDIKVAFDERR